MDLSAPSSTATALSATDVERFARDGFLVIDDILDTDEVTELLACIESPDTVNAVTSAGGDYQTVHLLSLTTRHPVFRRLAMDPRIVDRLAALIGPDIQLQHSKLAAQSRTAGQGGFGWHQDFAFFPHTNTQLVAVMVMLDDATPDNGCMQMVPGSHKQGLLDHTVDGYFAGKCQATHLWNDPAAQVAITPRAGGISIHHCLTLHGSGRNISGHPRRGLVFQYRADDAYQLADEIWVDTGLIVKGQRRGIVRCDAQSVLLPLHRGSTSDNPYRSAWHQEGTTARDWNHPAV